MTASVSGDPCGSLLVELDIARALPVSYRGRRNRLYVYDRYVSVLNEGTEVEPG